MNDKIAFMVILTKICAAISTVVQVRYDTVPVSGTNEPYLYYSMITVVLLTVFRH